MAIKGPGILSAQFMTKEPPRDNLENFSTWAADLGFKGLQLMPEPQVIDLDKGAVSKTYCDEWAGKLKAKGLICTDFHAAIFSQMLAFNPAYETLFEGFHPKGLKGKELTDWATNGLKKLIKTAANLGISGFPVLSGGLAWIMVYPWPQRPAGIIETAFKELARRWLPILDYAQENGVTINYELHPCCDLFDGATFDMFLEQVKDHPAACLTYDPSHFILQQLDLYEFIKIYGSRIKGFHVKDGEFIPSGKQGVYSGLQPWATRAGRFRTVGDGQVDFKRVFSLLTEVGFDGWAILEWEDPVRSPEQAAKRSVKFIEDHIIETADYAFDNFLDGGADISAHNKILGI
jgi:sugar phosphate isomerase/epimerase